MADVKKGSRYSLDGIDRTVAVLEAFEKRTTLSLAELARATELSEATALRYLTSLAGHGLIERDEETRRFRLGMRLFELGHQALGDRDPRKAAIRAMEDLREQLGETVNLAMRHGRELILIEALESTRSVRKGATVGERDCWYASSLGKAILAYLPVEDARGILGRAPWHRFTPTTRITWAELAADLLDTRERGYSIDDEENEEGLRCIGAVVFDRFGRPSYALSLSAPATRLSRDLFEQVGDRVNRAAESVSIALGFAVGATRP